MIKKRSSNFLILEVLIAFLLISMTILPFSSYPYRAFAKEMQHLESMAIEPYFVAAFLETKQHQDQETVELQNLQIPFGKDKTLTLQRSAKIKKKFDKEKSSSALLTIDLTLKTRHACKKKQMKIFIKNPESP